MQNEPLRPITPEGDLYAKLTIPTLSDGASISMVEAGNYSGGSVKNEEYANYISNLTINSDGIEIGILLEEFGFSGKLGAQSGDSADRTMRIPMADITDVRKVEIKYHPSLIFETESHVYRLKFAKQRGILWLSTPDFDESPIDQSLSKIRELMGGPPSSEASETDAEESFVEKLDRLSDLHQQGSITDEEYEKAKEKILD